MQAVRVCVVRQIENRDHMTLVVPDDWDEDRIRATAVQLSERADRDVEFPEGADVSRETRRPTPSRIQNHDDADYVFDAQGRLGFDRPCNEPPPEAWVSWDGHRWATDGRVLMREDGPRPRRHVEWKTERLPGPDDFHLIAGGRAPWTEVRLTDELRPSDEVGALVRMLARPGEMVSGLDERVTRAFPPGSTLQAKGSDPIVRLCVDGEPVLYSATWRPETP